MPRVPVAPVVGARPGGGRALDPRVSTRGFFNQRSRIQAPGGSPGVSAENTPNATQTPGGSPGVSAENTPNATQTPGGSPGVSDENTPNAMQAPGGSPGVSAGEACYRLLNCVPRRAPRRPYFFRSFMRPSRVSSPP